MKVLWFSNSYVDYVNQQSGYNGGGWMTSLKKTFDDKEDISLGIVFNYPGSTSKKKIANTTYYPTSIHFKTWQKLYNKLYSLLWKEELYRKIDDQYVQIYLNIIDDFKPDIIHIWGTEKNFGLISKHVDIPVIIHLQGIINPYLNTFFPPNYSLNFFKNFQFNTKKTLEYRNWELIAKREVEIFRSCKFYMGRTEWDKSISSIFSPNSLYFHCNEALRDVFHSDMHWKYPESKKLNIVSVISSPLYKGGDIILKSANILKIFFDVPFEWIVCGIDNLDVQERFLNIKANDVNISFHGIKGPEEIFKEMLSSHVFVHPSYIDNSPNSICEAQLVGIPVIANDVGGVSSLINNNIDGILVPANDPYLLSLKIIEIFKDKNRSAFISKNAIEVASKRHDIKTISDIVYTIYNKIQK